MKNFLKYLVCILASLGLSACNKPDDGGVIKLSTKTLTFESRSAAQTVYSYGEGMFLDAIVIDGTVVSEQTIAEDGSLVLDAGWISAVTPGMGANRLAAKIIVSVRGNNGDSSRSCEVLVHNGTQREKIQVTQNPENKDK